MRHFLKLIASKDRIHFKNRIYMRTLSIIQTRRCEKRAYICYVDRRVHRLSISISIIKFATHRAVHPRLEASIKKAAATERKMPRLNVVHKLVKLEYVQENAALAEFNNDVVRYVENSCHYSSLPRGDSIFSSSGKYHVYKRGTMLLAICSDIARGVDSLSVIIRRQLRIIRLRPPCQHGEFAPR